MEGNDDGGAETSISSLARWMKQACRLIALFAREGERPFLSAASSSPQSPHARSTVAPISLGRARKNERSGSVSAALKECLPTANSAFPPSPFPSAHSGINRESYPLPLLRVLPPPSPVSGRSFTRLVKIDAVCIPPHPSHRQGAPKGARVEE